MSAHWGILRKVYDNLITRTKYTVWKWTVSSQDSRRNKLRGLHAFFPLLVKFTLFDPRSLTLEFYNLSIDGELTATSDKIVISDGPKSPLNTGEIFKTEM